MAELTQLVDERAGRVARVLGADQNGGCQPTRASDGVSAVNARGNQWLIIHHSRFACAALWIVISGMLMLAPASRSNLGPLVQERMSSGSFSGRPRAIDPSRPEGPGGTDDELPGDYRSSTMRNHVIAAFTTTIVAMNSNGADIRVPQDAPTIQAAVDGAQSGDRVLVAPGTHAPFSFRSKRIAVIAVAGPDTTTIDASGQPRSAVTFGSGSGFDTVLRGFTIRTGRGDLIGAWPHGGGCLLYGNAATSTPSLGTIEDCRFIGSTGGCGYGAGVSVRYGHVAMRRCTFDGTNAEHHGPAMEVDPTPLGIEVPGAPGFHLLIEDCAVSNTHSYNDGGFLIGLPSPAGPFKVRIARTSFVGNSGTIGVGALVIGTGPGLPSEFNVEQCVFQGNSGTSAKSLSVGIPGISPGGGATRLKISDCVFFDAATAINTSLGMQTSIARTALCAGANSVVGAYTDGGGNSLSCGSPSDCDQDGINDLWSTTLGNVLDVNHDHVPDSCQCLADLTADGQVNGADLGAVLAFWGPNPAFPAADLNADGFVDGADLGLVLAAWGPCGP